jgi:hypothetical protein
MPPNNQMNSNSVPPQSQNGGPSTPDPKPPRQIDDGLRPFDPAYKNLFLNQYNTGVDSSPQIQPVNHHQGASQNWWNIDPNFYGYPAKSPFETPYQQNGQPPFPVYQENVQPPNPQFFVPTTTRVYTTPPPPPTTTSVPYYNNNNNNNGYNNGYPGNNNQQQWPMNPNNWRPSNPNWNPNNGNPNNGNPNWNPNNGNPNNGNPQQWPMNPNQNWNQGQQDYNSGIFQQFYRMTTTTDMPNYTVKHVPDTYSKSFNPYEGMTERRRPVTPQVAWYSRYYDLTVPIAALPFNNYKNIKK